MKRRYFLGQLASGALGSALVTSNTSFAQSLDRTAKLTLTPLVLMAPRPDGLEAVWAVGKLSRGRLEWESDDGTSGEAATDPFGFVPQGQKILRVRLEGLKPGKTYRVRSVTVATDTAETETSAWKTFRTLNPAAAETSFVVWNDTHINNPTIQQLHERTPSADFLLWNGDTCNDWKTEDLLVPTLLNPGGRDISSDRPVFVVWGNHDVRGKHAFEMPSMVATPSGRPFYAFRSGPVAFICLHTGEDKPDSHPSFGGRVAFDRLRKEQAGWLAETIRRPEIGGAPFRVVFCHIPLRWVDESPRDYANGGYDWFSARSRAAWHDILVAWKAQIIISGHTHRTTWMPPASGFPYGQLIGGGPTPQAATYMEAKATSGLLRIVVRDLGGQVKHDISLNPVV